MSDGLSFAEAIELAALGGRERYILVRDCWCPEHGRHRPEALAFPFTATPAALAFQHPSCAIPWCEADLVIDAVLTDETEVQHMAEVLRDGISQPRVVIELRPVEPGVWRHGSRVVAGEFVDDRPSGAAITPTLETLARTRERLGRR